MQYIYTDTYLHLTFINKWTHLAYNLRYMYYRNKNAYLIDKNKAQKNKDDSFQIIYKINIYNI